MAIAIACALPLPVRALDAADRDAGDSHATQPRVSHTVELQAGIHRIRAEVADSEDTRQRGLMWRQRLGPNEGMLFIFEQSERYCFWMKNTLIPLSIAFIDDQSEIVNIAEMQSQSETQHCPERRIRYALEMNAGWFTKHGVKAGHTLRGIGDATTK